MRPLLIAIALFISSIALHLITFLLHGPHPLGYDTGFYRRYLIEPFLSIPNTAVPGLGIDAYVPRIVLDLLRLTHLPPDLILYGSYVCFFALLPVVVFFFLKPTLGIRGSVIAAAFTILSSVSYNAFWYMLFKNALALDLMILAFIAFERRFVIGTLLLGVLIALSHTTSAIIFLSTLGVLFIIGSGRRKEILIHAAVTLAAFALVNGSAVREVRVALPTALFIEWSQYLWFSLPFFLLMAAGWKCVHHAKFPVTLIAFAVASISFPLFHLPFYERIFVFSDVAAAMLAAYAASYLLSRLDFSEINARIYFPGAVLCVASGLLLGTMYDQVRSLGPLVPHEQIKKIEAAGLTLPADAYVLTSANEAPWYEGWTSAHIIAPGLLRDRHNLEDWEALWSATSTDMRIGFLASFPQPLYISTTANIEHLIGNPPACVHLVAPDVYLDECNTALKN